MCTCTGDQPGLGDLFLPAAISESLPIVSRVRGVAVGVVNGGEGVWFQVAWNWVGSEGVAFL